jgi:hypothetical protein
MTLMAGFDLVAEVSNETIRKLIMSKLTIGGVVANPPFELSLPIPIPGGGKGSAYLMVTDLQVDLNADDTITLTLSFDRMSVVPIPNLPFAICPLDGNITITTAALQLISAGSPDMQQVSLDLLAATVAINWSAAADQEITKDLASLGGIVTPKDFKNLASNGMTNYVRKLPAPVLPYEFRVVPGVEGSVSPTLQFERLEVHCIPNPNRNQQALGLFGILLKANDANGDHTQKTSTAISAAHDGVCISMAPGAFHQLVFCPGIAQALKLTDPTKLPGSCGPAGGLDTQGVTINSIFDSFANDHIDINGSISKSGFCYDASGTFHATLTSAASGSTLQLNVLTDTPDIDVSIPWYCVVVAGVVLGPIGIALAAVVEAVTQAVVNNIASSLGGRSLSVGGLPGGGLLYGAFFDNLAITTEGLTLQGIFPLSVYHPFVMPKLDLNGSVTMTNRQDIGSGIFHAQIWCMQQAKDYPYTEYAQQQTGTYKLSGTMVSQPLTPEFTIDADGPAIPLSGKQGKVTIPNVITHYPMPLATGGTAMQQTVNIDYFISGTSIKLTNIPAEGDYSFYLNVSATDCSNKPVQDDMQKDLHARIQVQFEGDHVDIGGGYAADVQSCGQHLRQWLEEVIDKYTPEQIVPIWQQVNYPPVEGLVEYIRDVVALGIPEADEILVASKIAHGNSFSRAIFSEAASQPGLLGKNTNLARDERLANVARELTSLSQQLLDAGNITQSVDVLDGISEEV